MTICSWCEKTLKKPAPAAAAPQGTTTVSHGICASCAALQLRHRLAARVRSVLAPNPAR